MGERGPSPNRCPGCGGTKKERREIVVYPGKSVLCKHPYHGGIDGR